MVPNEELHILTIHYEPPKRGQPLYKGLIPRCPIKALFQDVLYNGGSMLTHYAII